MLNAVLVLVIVTSGWSILTARFLRQSTDGACPLRRQPPLHDGRNAPQRNFEGRMRFHFDEVGDGIAPPQEPDRRRPHKPKIRSITVTKPGSPHRSVCCHKLTKQDCAQSHDRCRRPGKNRQHARHNSSAPESERAMVEKKSTKEQGQEERRIEKM
jgi:hypothetical protein